MMGRAHLASGVAVGLNAATAAHLPPGTAVLLAAVCGGAAVLPDIDHPDASVSKSLGPATWLLAWVVGRMSGGHRNGTHSATGCSLLAGAAFAATAVVVADRAVAVQGLVCIGVLLATAVATFAMVGGNGQTCYKTAWGGPAVIAILGFATLAAAAATLAFGPIVARAGLGVLILLALAAAARAARIPGKADEGLAVVVAYWAVAPPGWRYDLPEPDLRLMPWALTVGVVVHCFGDCITKGGVPWAWPLTQVNVGLQVIVTNGPVERRILMPGFVLAIGAGMAWLVNPAVGAVTALALWWLLAATPDRKPARRKPAARRKAGAGRKKPARAR